jgi:hypothetical protein
VRRWLLALFAAMILAPSGCYISNYPEYEPSKPEYLLKQYEPSEPVREETIEETREKHSGPYEPVVPGR